MNSSHIDSETLIHFTNQFEKSPKAIDSKLIWHWARVNSEKISISVVYPEIALSDVSGGFRTWNDRCWPPFLHHVTVLRNNYVFSLNRNGQFFNTDISDIGLIFLEMLKRVREKVAWGHRGSHIGSRVFLEFSISVNFCLLLK